jgi:hypothetical protein
MRKADAGSLMLALRAWLDEDERNVRRIIEYVITRAMAGHIGYFRFVIDTVDGPIRPTTEEEWTFEPDSVLIVADDRREVEPAKAARSCHFASLSLAIDPVDSSSEGERAPPFPRSILKVLEIDGSF